MNVPVTFIARKYRIFLPYWAVFQTDLHQTLRNWIYITWVAGTLLAAFGFLLFRIGVHRVAGMVQYASVAMSDMLHWIVLGSLALIAVQTVGAISSERGTLADSVLSRGISRYQYFLAKWHSRLFCILGSYLAMSGIMLIFSHFLLHEDLSLLGSIIAIWTMASFLVVVISCGVMLSSICKSTLMGMTIIWLVMYGGGYLLELLPATYPSPNRILNQLPLMMQGQYNMSAFWELMMMTGIVSGAMAFVGLVSFSRSDV